MKRLMKKGENSMQLIYALEDLPKNITKSIFLAGPTPRSNSIISWRKEAIKLLKENNYDGVVFIPEPRNGEFTSNYDNQIEWEEKMMDLSDCILFWIDRKLRPDFENIALTTNIEWGKYCNSGKVVVGFPEDAEKTRYIKHQIDKLQLNYNDTLEKTIKEALEFIGDGSLRSDGECFVPLNIWNTKMFQNWYVAQKQVGNELRYAKVNYVFVMPKARKTFLWILGVHVYIKAEDRIKENEFVLSRTDICSAVIYKRNENLMDSEVVLVKEFRSPGCNSEAMVYELPGGSSIEESENLETVYHEIQEETGLDINKERIVYENSRQIAATLSAHKCHLYSIEINDEEVQSIIDGKNEVHGVEEDSERTYTEIVKVKDVIDNDLLDWGNIGMILSIINNK